MIYTWTSYIFARLSGGEIASSLLMALVEMLRNGLCLITSFYQESAKIWAEWGQTFPQELHSAPTAKPESGNRSYTASSNSLRVSPCLQKDTRS